MPANSLFNSIHRNDICPQAPPKYTLPAGVLRNMLRYCDQEDTPPIQARVTHVRSSLQIAEVGGSSLRVRFEEAIPDGTWSGAYGAVVWFADVGPLCSLVSMLPRTSESARARAEVMVFDTCRQSGCRLRVVGAERVAQLASEGELLKVRVLQPRLAPFDSMAQGPWLRDRIHMLCGELSRLFSTPSML